MRLRSPLCFTPQVFPEDVLAKQVLASEPTMGLHEGVTGMQPVHGVFHVMRSRIFVKHRIQPREWILRQVPCALIAVVLQCLQLPIFLSHTSRPH